MSATSSPHARREITPAKVAEAISRCRPDWGVDAIAHLGEGDFCSAYVVNDEWVFRVAKHDEARESLRREFCLLPKLAKRLTLRIPSPQIADLDEQAELPFVGYPLLPGPALSQARYLNLDEPERTRCAEQVGNFLTQLHAVELETARACLVPVVEYARRYSDLLTRARADLYPALDEPERLFIERVIAGYLESGDAESFRPALLHGDLGPSHVLFDEASVSVSAVIDFGDMMIGDPAWDLVFIYEDYGVDFLSRLLNTYAGHDRASLLRRAYQLYLLDAMYWTAGQRSAGDAAFAEALAQLRSMRVEDEERRRELLSIRLN